ncbi:MAG: LacI family DNA-binding transcriptional regulator [Armatimonadota bacterium]
MLTKQVTLQDIADRCGVHKMTVSRALRGDHNLRKENIERICAVAAEMGYDPAQHHVARRLAMQKYGQQVTNQVLALFCPPSFARNNYFATMLQGIIDAVTPRKYAVLTLCTGEADIERDGRIVLPPVFSRGDVDGAIVFDNPITFAPMLDYLRASGGFGQRPIVSLMRPLPGCAGVLTDDRQGAYAAAVHLLDIGHRNIIHFCINREEDYQSNERYLGYAQAFQERGLDPEKYLIPADYDYRIAPEERHSAAACASLRAHPAATAILARNDIGAVQIWTRCRREGLRVPQDISLVGFDDAFSICNEYQENILTTVQLPLEEVGRQAAGMIMRQVESAVNPSEQVMLPSSLVLRGTTGPCRRFPV